MLRWFLPLVLACAVAPAVAQPSALNPNMDYDGHIALIQEVRPYRLARLIDWAAFAAAAREPGVLILDARSERQFAEGHITGAVNLPLPEFSAARLAELIGANRDRPILIYCNNNFRDDRPPVILKSLRLALNISTFTHLYGYGYHNIRELNELVTMDDPRVRWVTGPAQSGAATPR